MALLDFNDYPAVRQQIRDRTLDAVTKAFPVSNEQYTLQLSGLSVGGPERYSLKEQKKAILEGKTLSNRLTGKWEVLDNASGQVVSRSGKKTIVNVPYITDRGTFIRNGAEYTTSRQFRLVPNVYTRVADDGRIESQFNIKPRTGRQFRLYMEPKSSVFYIRHGNRTVPLYPFLQTMGYPDEQLAEVWGKEILSANKNQQDSAHANRLIKDLVIAEQERLEKQAADADEMRRLLVMHFARMELDPEATETTLNQRFENVTPASMVSATRKILAVSRGDEDSDDRDSLEFQTVHDISDFLPEKIALDQGGLVRRALWNVTKHGGDANRIPSGLMDKHSDTVFNISGLAQPIEEINPLDPFDQNQRVVRLGEGGIRDVDSVPKEARAVQPSYMNFVDPVRAPESLKVGVDMKLAKNVRKGPDNLLYSQFHNPRNNKKEWISSKQAARSIVGLPDSIEGNYWQDWLFAPAIVKSKGIFWVPRNSIEYQMSDGDEMFSYGANLVPLKSGTKAMRLLLGGKHSSQALPLVSREEPLVQSKGSPEALEKKVGPALGTIRSRKPGAVKAVFSNHIDVVYDDGEKESIDTYDNFPFSRKTFIRNMPNVKAGDRFGKDQMLASSNYTDPKTGNAAMGKNLRVAYTTYHGKNFEDAIVISESAAQNLTSEHMLNTKIEKAKDLRINKQTFRALYPGKFNKKQMDSITDDGVVKTGTVVNYGDPLFLAVRETPPGPGTLGRRVRRSEAVTWKHPYSAVVTDAAKTKKGFTVFTRANIPMRVGDKITNRFGGKGVIADIVPDNDMMKDAQGRTIDIALHPLGVISRINPSQMLETQLGKVAEKTGKPYVLPGFSQDDMVKFTEDELRKHGLKDTEDLYDPLSGKTIPQVFTGKSYFYKLSHTSESKGKARATGGYTLEDQPAKGGAEGAKHIGDMEIQALLSHGATDVLKDLKIIKGQKNDDFWRQLKLGQTPTMPGTPMVYDKFRALIKAAGVQLREGKSADHIFAMTNKQAQELTGTRRIKSSNTYGATSMKPLEGGLFDPDATGSLTTGDRWGYVQLPEPMPNPVMEEPMRVLLDMTQKDFNKLVRGDVEVEGKFGGEALREKLRRLDFNSLKDNLIDEVRNGVKSRRDKAVKRLGVVTALEKQGLRPEDFLMDRVPVLPPKFRPVVRHNEMTLVSDTNYLYKNLIDSVEDYNETKELPGEIQRTARQAMYDNYKSLVGIADPVQQDLQQKRVGGILKQLLGKGSPKGGFVQRRVIGTNIDVSGLAVVTPNPSLKLNEVGLPEEKAWDLYEPFIIRDMVQNGYPARAAATAVANKDKVASKSLQTVIKQRPVLINRAPTLHKYNILAFWPVLTKGSTLQVPPTIVKPFGMDFDGDTGSYSVPVSEKAVEQAVALMLPEKNLLSARSGRPTFTPSNEYVQGLYFSTKEPTKKEAKHFATKQTALEAYRRGEIAVDDPITIGS
ncbi:MAG: hypothetical protein ACYTEQ_09315 [Planctomycetota bacterium]|jgi:DNA-directed RNA polymerase beta subunit